MTRFVCFMGVSLIVLLPRWDKAYFRKQLTIIKGLDDPSRVVDDYPPELLAPGKGRREHARPTVPFLAELNHQPSDIRPGRRLLSRVNADGVL